MCCPGINTEPTKELYNLELNFNFNFKKWFETCSHCCPELDENTDTTLQEVSTVITKIQALFLGWGLLAPAKK